jgi:SAM-dependent methyltransferase
MNLSPYSSGEYFQDASRHSGDALFKASEFLALLRRNPEATERRLSSYVDVGCGSGHVVRHVAQGLRESGFDLVRVMGYDVSPHVIRLSVNGIEFLHGDFSQSGEDADLVTLFDVIEHVPAPVDFLRRLSERCRLIGLHIPLDNSLNGAVRDLFHSKLANPGHLLFMDTAAALNLLTLAGLRVIDYKYTHAFQAPSGRASAAANFMYPLRALTARVSPWLVSKLMGGASLMVIAITPRYDLCP